MPEDGLGVCHYGCVDLSNQLFLVFGVPDENSRSPGVIFRAPGNLSSVSEGLAFTGSYGDFMLDKRANDMLVEFLHSKINSIVEDPEVAAQLCSTNIISGKRLCVDTNLLLVPFVAWAYFISCQ